MSHYNKELYKTTGRVTYIALITYFLNVLINNFIGINKMY